jgi:hypothetical protein
MIDKSEQINELAAALSKAQAKLSHVKKDKTARIRMKAGGEYSYNYADLGSTWDAGRAPLTENDLSVSQLPSFDSGWLMLDTILMHSSGQYISSQMRTRADEMDVKSIGSAITYLRRYAFAAIVGLVADEDDDGSAPNPSGKATEPAHTNGHAPAANGSAPGKASDKQKKMLFAIWNKGSYEGKLTDWIAESFGCGIDDISLKQASEAIETLQPSEKASG